MSQESGKIKKIIRMPVITSNPELLDIPGVMLSVSIEEGEKMGAIEEHAMSFEDAWDSNADLIFEKHGYGIIDDEDINEDLRSNDHILDK